MSIESTAANPQKVWEAYTYAATMLGEMAVTFGANIHIEPFESNGKPSLLAWHGNSSRPEHFQVLLNGHVDVVPGTPEQFDPKLQDGKLYGRGAYDMKAAGVAMAAAFCEHPGTGLQLVTDEETGGENGTAYQIEQGVRADFIICGESGRPEGVAEIANEAKGMLIADVTFAGDPAHSAYPWQGKNPIIAANNFLNKLQERYPTPTSDAAGNAVTTVTPIGNSAGNDTLSQTPDLARLRLDSRYLIGDPQFETLEDFEMLVKDLGATAQIEKVLTFADPIYTEPGYPMLQALMAAAKTVEGQPFNLVRRNGTSDGRFYRHVGGRAVEFGIAGSGQHGSEEYITVKALENYYQTLRMFLGDVTAKKLPNQRTETVLS
jgi:succinyl-diaminopimelate desuccinylase